MERHEHGESLRAAAHALRSPLNGIIGLAELLHDEKVGPLSAEQKEFLADILTSAQDLRRAVDGVLDRLRRQSGQNGGSGRSGE